MRPSPDGVCSMKPAEPRDAKPEHNDQRSGPSPETPDVGAPTTLNASDVGSARDQQRRGDFTVFIGEPNSRQSLEGYLDGKYGADIREIRSEQSKLQDLVQNSGRLRLGWLKLTKQISSDPHRDLHTLNLLAEGYEQRYADELRFFDDQKLERQAEEASRQARRINEARLLRTMGPDEAFDLAEAMLDKGHRPIPELYRRAGLDVSPQRIGDATVPGFINDNLPRDLGPVPDDADFGVDFEPPF
jgi:hypothetical protein